MTGPRPSVVAAPIADESIASLVARTARANQVSVDVLVASLGLPSTPSSDRSTKGKRTGSGSLLFDPDAATAEALSVALRLAPSQVARRTPAWFAPVNTYLDRHDRTAPWRLRPDRIGTAGWFHWGATGFCPSCLQERPDVSRFGWQVALQPVCVEHAALIHELCPTCDTPAAYRPFRSFNGRIPACMKCRADLRFAPRVAANADLADSASLLQRLLDMPEVYFEKIGDVTYWLRTMLNPRDRRRAPRRERGPAAPTAKALAPYPRRVATAGYLSWAVGLVLRDTTVPETGTVDHT